MLGCLRALDAGLRERGSGLVVREGRPERELAALAGEVGADAVLWTSDVAPYARARDRRVSEALRAAGRRSGAAGRRLRRRRLHAAHAGRQAVHRLHAVLQALAHARAPHRAPRAGASSHRCRAPCARAGCPRRAGARRARASRTARPARRPRGRRWPRGSTGRSTATPPPTTPSATSTARAACRRSCAGAACRPRSARRARRAAAAPAPRRGSASCAGATSTPTSCSPTPATPAVSIRRSTATWNGRTTTTRSTAWREGRTGYPLVDAGMRQLARTGWMHNRARLVVGSFLTKDLHLDWRLGERHFEALLLDGEPAQNNGNWQWVTSVGVDPAPYFRRMFNPVLQQRKFDPDGVYVRRWVPELRDVPGERLAEPWRMSDEQQRAARLRHRPRLPGADRRPCRRAQAGDRALPRRGRLRRRRRLSPAARPACGR